MNATVDASLSLCGPQDSWDWTQQPAADVLFFLKQESALKSDDFVSPIQI